ncbi:autotransporter outer membrane beta-barrel domain-containing protein [Dissulfurispira sp.]|uniref:autotransporter outer membrane beta-barrel domain-containing protein n=1 Tax=Dissulfurispira sp. TaxID=2817609 RepID=UPI002FDA48B9
MCLKKLNKTMVLLIASAVLLSLSPVLSYGFDGLGLNPKTIEGVSCSHTSRARISISGFTLLEAIVIGRIVTEDVKRDVVTPFINFRYGIAKDLQFEVKVPWMYRRDKEVWVAGPSGTDEMERTVDESNLGDIEAALNYQLLRERGAWPDIVLNIRGKSTTGKDPYGLKTELIEGKQRLVELPTGSGHYGLSAGLTFVKSSDPAVLFATLGYFYNFERNVGVKGGVDYGKIKPGDSLELGLGMAYALNEKLSTSISYQQRFTFKSKQNGNKVTNSDVNVGSLFFGVSHALGAKTSLSFSVGVGLTKDAPDVTVEMRVPFTL